MQNQNVLQHRRDRITYKIRQLTAIERRFPWLRLGVVLIVLVSAFIAFQLVPAALAWLVVFLGAFIFGWTANRHEAVIARIRQLQTYQSMLEAHIARSRLDWPNIPAAANLHPAPDHPFANDLQVMGNGSLHQILDTTTSLGGSQMLANWLLAENPDPQAAQQRQRGARALLARPAFCTQLELNGLLACPEGTRHINTAPLITWINSHQQGPKMGRFLLLLSVLSAANITLFALSTAGLLPPWWIATWIVYLGVQSLRYRETSETFDESYSLARQLSGLRRVLVGLEQTHSPADASLESLWQAFHTGPRPSHALRRVDRIVSAASLRNNPFLSLPLNLLLPYDVFLTYQLERVKEDLGGAMPRWLNAWHTLEALAALANFTALQPRTCFPVFLPAQSQPVFLAKQVGHPLIAIEARVDNDFTIQHHGQVGIITGSNMSGKSTFLRTLGINLVLMNAGGPAAATEFAAVPFRIFTSMTVTDSLSDGISYFYAEVRRLKALLDALDAAAQHPLFFLIDEIFRGTNNRERQIGSQSYTRALTGKFGTGFLSTHDLELAHLAETLPQVQNFHFREDIRDGKMIFDYILRPGPSPTTNALRIMALAGLPTGGINSA